MTHIEHANAQVGEVDQEERVDSAIHLVEMTGEEFERFITFAAQVVHGEVDLQLPDDPDEA